MIVIITGMGQVLSGSEEGSPQLHYQQHPLLDTSHSNAETHSFGSTCHDLPPGSKSVGHMERSPSDRGHCSLV